MSCTRPGMTKRRVNIGRVIQESYDFGELSLNHDQTTPTFPGDHAQLLNSPVQFFAMARETGSLLPILRNEERVSVTTFLTLSIYN